MEGLYRNCALCPRNCHVDRNAGGVGFCGETSTLRAAWAGIHLGEEPVLTGKGGSGTVFFSGCTLRCPFCQNCQLSGPGWRQGPSGPVREVKGSLGVEITPAFLAGLFLRLQYAGAENVNLVTGTHFAPGILEALRQARSGGLAIPALWNSCGYEGTGTVELLAREVEVFLPDCKTLDPELSRWLFRAPDYPQATREAILLMAEARPLLLGEETLKQGVIVRHLVLPGQLESTRSVLEWFREALYGRALLSLMFQYTPVPVGPGVLAGGVRTLLPGLERQTNALEVEQVLLWLEELGIKEGFVQEPETSAGWWPDFLRPNPFPEGQARPLWHCLYGELNPLR